MFPNDMLSLLQALCPFVHHIKSNNAFTETKAFTLLLKSNVEQQTTFLKKKNHYVTTETNLCKSISILHVKKTITYCVSLQIIRITRGVVNLPANPNPHQSARRTFDCAPQSRCAIWIPRGDQLGGVFDPWSLLNNDRTSRFSNRKILQSR